MAHLIGLESIRIMVGSRVLLDDITLGIDDGTRVGVHVDHQGNRSVSTSR